MEENKQNNTSAKTKKELEEANAKIAQLQQEIESLNAQLAVKNEENARLSIDFNNAMQAQDRRINELHRVIALFNQSKTVFDATLAMANSIYEPLIAEISK